MEAERGSGKGAESWLPLSEGLIAGIHHALNNRMAALRAVGQVVDADLPFDHPLSGAMAGELERLERTAELLALLTPGDAGLEPVLVDEVVGNAVRLFEMHHSLRDRRVEARYAPGLLPVLGNRADLLRALLMMLAIAGRDRGGDLRIEVEGDARVVRLSVVGENGVEPPEGDPGLRSVSLSGLEQVLQRAGASLTEGAGPDRIQAAILTLPEARRIEREGGS